MQRFVNWLIKRWEITFQSQNIDIYFAKRGAKNALALKELIGNV